VVWPWLATKDHVVALSHLSLVGWGGEWKKKDITRGSGAGQFNGTSNDVNNNNINTGKKNTQYKQLNTQRNSHRPLPCMLQSCN